MCSFHLTAYFYDVFYRIAECPWLEMKLEISVR